MARPSTLKRIIFRGVNQPVLQSSVAIGDIRFLWQASIDSGMDCPAMIGLQWMDARGAVECFVEEVAPVPTS